MKKIKKVIAVSLAIVPWAVLSAASLSNPLGDATIQTLLTSILKIVVQIGVPVLVLVFVYIGFMFVQAQGEPTKLETARNAFFWAVIGAGVVLGAAVIKTAICDTIGTLGTNALSCN